MPGSNLANLRAAGDTRARANLETELLNSLGEAVIATDLHGYVIFWNRAAERLYGWTADEVEGRSILDVTPAAESRAAAVAIFEKVTKGETWSGEFETRHKDGRRLLVDVTDYPVRDLQGKLTAIVGISKAVEKTAAAAREPASRTAAPLFDAASASLRSLFRGSTHDTERAHLWRGFAIAFLLYGVALGGRLLLDHILPGRVPFISFFPAILVSTFICGLWPTVVLLLASGITGAFLMALPEAGNLLEYRIFAGALFVAIGGMVISPVIYATSVHRRLKLKEEHLSLVNRELKHRIKNLFAVTSSICLQTIKGKESREDMATAIAGRIQAVASAQDLVSATSAEGSDLRALVEAVVKPLSPDAARLEITGPQVSLPSEATIPFALILHELATNALKYGAWASTRGRTSIQWRLPTERLLEFAWREEDVVLSSRPRSEGFGSVIIKRALSQAKVSHEIGPQGVFCRIELPL